MADGDFYPGGSNLPGPKPDAYWGRSGGADFNAVREALTDLRTGLESFTPPTIERSARLGELGIWVGAGAPTSPLTYSQWVAGAPGHWAWIEIP